MDFDNRLMALCKAHQESTEGVRHYVDEILQLADYTFPNLINSTDEERWNSRSWKKIRADCLEIKRKMPGTLLEMALIYRVALHDAFIPGLARVILATRPQLLKTSKQLAHRQIIEQPSLESLIEFMAEREVQELTHLSLKDQRQWLSNHLHVDPFWDGECYYEQMQELVARRNLFVHANGVVNQSYLSLVKGTSHKMGERLSVDERYWQRSSNFLSAFENEYVEILVEKHGDA